MGQYIGIDLHKAKSFVTRMDGRGRVREQVELAHATGALKDYLERLPADSRIAVEATGNWMWLYEWIEERHPRLVLAHPLKTKAIASARIKTDKIDATTLAHLLRADLVPAAYIPPRAVRDTRELLRYRASLVRLRREKGVGSLSFVITFPLVSRETEASIPAPSALRFGSPMPRYRMVVRD